jgi:LPXTG-motif cell wall-anchored protein
VALLGSDRFAAIGGGIAMILGPLVYFGVRRRRS